MLKDYFRKLYVNRFFPAMGGEMILEMKNEEGQRMTRQEAGRKGGEKARGKEERSYTEGLVARAVRQWLRCVGQSSTGKLAVGAEKAGEA